MNVLPAGAAAAALLLSLRSSPHPAVTVRGGVVDDVSEVRLIFDRGSLAETMYTLDVATARRVAYDLREAADVAERHRRAGWPASAGALDAL
jgi:hypothetical protein